MAKTPPAPATQVDVPTMDDFNALADRVTSLEGRVDDLDLRVDTLEEAGGSTPPQPIPPDPGPDPIPPDPIPSPGQGVKAWRIADVVNLFGVNTFSSLDEGNMWGSYPADYRPEQVIKAIKYLTGDGQTGHTIRVREYHYQGREDMQRQWWAQISQACPGTDLAMCVAANGGVNDTQSMVNMRDVVKWFEGLNEPNTNFGSGEVPLDQTMAIQDTLWNSGVNHPIMGPSVVAGMPHPEGWITGYFGQSMDKVNSQMDWGNGHFYPPHCPDLTGDGASLAEYVGGLYQAYGNHVIAITEFHPSLYNSDGNKPDQPGWNGDRDAYYTLLALLRSAKITTEGLWWYALFDYGTVYYCGLFPKNGSDPRPAANAIRTLCTTCPDQSAENRTFETDSLDVKVNLPDRCDFLLAQAEAGEFYLFLWHSEPEPGGNAVQVNVTLPQSMTIKGFDLLSGEKSEQANAAHFTVDLPATVRVFVLT